MRIFLLTFQCARGFTVTSWRSTCATFETRSFVPAVIDRDGLRRLVDDEHVQLVEVLPKEEYDEEHLPGALHLPLKQLDAHAAARTLDARRPVVVYCWDGL
jgi:hypothetical protein